MAPLACFAQPATRDLPASAPEATQGNAIPRDPTLPTIFIASDSTAAKSDKATQQGWGEPFAQYFESTKMNVVNRARGGRSSRTFITEGLWDKLLAEVKAGDFVIIQFGHNDASPVNEDLSVPREKMRSRGSLPGLGNESQEIENVITGKHEVVHTFGWYIRRMIADVKARQATPIIASLTVRNLWEDGKVERGSSDYRKWSEALAREHNLRFVDLTRIVADRYQAFGPEKVKSFFGSDYVHTNPEGAEFNAAAMIAGLKGLIDSPFPKFLSEKGKTIEADR
ncbi:rhamnogalacturonan acetylesterase [Oleiharenicola lentus]|uniref:rhamnogalacturonan acetylesterase n=1 Tax=Oleiharenicola lentus TaxID=2508720 RepID=UPI003F680EA5